MKSHLFGEINYPTETRELKSLGVPEKRRGSLAGCAPLDRYGEFTAPKALNEEGTAGWGSCLVLGQRGNRLLKRHDLDC